MKDVHVLVDHEDRKARIAASLKPLLPQAAAASCDEPSDEVTGLVEWPNVIMGQIETEFMSLPPEVWLHPCGCIRNFCALTKGAAENLAPFFMTVTNRRSDLVNDKLIAAGNERVLRARLATPNFFMSRTNKHLWNSLAEKLEVITFYEGLGSVADKAERMAALPGPLQTTLMQLTRIQRAVQQYWPRLTWPQKWSVNFLNCRA